MRLRQVKQFLFAFHEAGACKASRAHGDQRLEDVEPAAERIVARMQERIDELEARLDGTAPNAE